MEQSLPQVLKKAINPMEDKEPRKHHTLNQQVSIFV